MTTIPGIKARHAIITPACRARRTDGGAFDEACRRLRQEYESIERTDDCTIHLVLTVELGQLTADGAHRMVLDAQPQVSDPLLTDLLQRIEEAAAAGHQKLDAFGALPRTARQQQAILREIRRRGFHCVNVASDALPGDEEEGRGVWEVRW
jgi:hypothetical protein